MKMSRKILAITILATCTYSTLGYSQEIVAADDSHITQLCMTALSGNRAAMHNGIKSSGYSKEFVAKNVRCNGVNILAFVDKHGKNANAMLKILDKGVRTTSITDLANNNIETK
jgi:hypothetical protein